MQKSTDNGRKSGSMASTSLAFVAVLLIVIRCAWSTMDSYFVGDDFAYIYHFSKFDIRQWPTLFISEWSGGIWGYVLPELRPFTALSFLIDCQLWNINPIGYHVTNVVYETGCSIYVFLILSRIHTVDLLISALAAMLFACMPAHSESLAWITGRVDLIATFAYLAGYYYSCRYLQSGHEVGLLSLSLLAYFVGCFSKEFCLTLPLMVLAWLMLVGSYKFPVEIRRIMSLYAGFVGVFVTYGAIRYHAFSNSLATGAGFDLFGREFIERQIDYFRWLLPPFYHLFRDYRPDLMLIAPYFVAGFMLIALLSLYILAVFQGKSSSTWRGFFLYAVVWYLIAVLPLCVATYFSPRHLHLASAGPVICAALFCHHFVRIRWVSMIILLVICVYSLVRYDHATTAWRHSARVSQRVSREIQQLSSASIKGHLVLVDVPDVYEGAWMWSWSLPFAISEPFLETSNLVFLEKPAVYFSPQTWTLNKKLRNLPEVTHITLVQVDHKGKVLSRSVPPAMFQQAAALMLSADPSPDQNTNWNRFISQLQP